jgi:small subunit ribosomal protein S3
MRADIDYGFSEAKTTYGVIGIKVWVFKGEIMPKNEQPLFGAIGAPTPEPEQPPARKARKTPARTGARRATTSQT